MPFRDKVKKAFGGKKDAKFDSSADNPPKRKDIEYYKPGEIPSSKYQGPWNQKHQDTLQAFSFEESFGNGKDPITPAYSPRGTLSQSRRSSWMNRARSSLGGRSDSGEDGPGVRRKSHASHVGKVVEEEGDDADVGNVGLSRPATAEQGKSDEANRLQIEKTLTQGDVSQGDSTPFTPEELSRAMTAATIKAEV